MSQLRVIVYCEGTSEYGQHLNTELAPTDTMPALSWLVHKILGEPGFATYKCMRLNSVLKRLHAAGHGKGKKLRKKVKYLVEEAYREGFGATVVVMDRDGDSSRLGDLVAGAKDTNADIVYPRCAVGTAIQSFDAWIIADPDALADGGGRKDCHRPEPEKLPADCHKRSIEKSAKDFASRAFGEDADLPSCYSRVMAAIDLEVLSRHCPKGFAPFAADVEQHVGLLVSGSG